MTVKSNTSESGITLLEMLAVLSILSISLILIAPNIKGPLKRATFQAEAQKLVETLESARALAIQKNESVEFTINVAEKTYHNSRNRAERTFPDDMSITVETAANDVIDNEAIISFYPDGSAKGAEIELIQNDRGVFISIDWLLGDIRMEPHRDKP